MPKLDDDGQMMSDDPSGPADQRGGKLEGDPDMPKGASATGGAQPLTEAARSSSREEPKADII
jgi:hypothetical protein